MKTSKTIENVVRPSQGQVLRPTKIGNGSHPNNNKNNNQITKKKKHGVMAIYISMFGLVVSLISLSQFRMGAHLLYVQDQNHRNRNIIGSRHGNNHNSNMLIPELNEWRNDAIDRFKKAHPHIEETKILDDVDEEEIMDDENEKQDNNDNNNEGAKERKEKINNVDAPFDVKPDQKTTGNAVGDRVTTANRNSSLRYNRKRSIKNNSRGMTVIYAIAVTECPEDNHVMYGAAVLAESIKNMSARRNSASKYDYSLYAFVHNDARACNAPLYSLGYTILNGKAPHSDKVDKEFIKLYAISLTSHDIVVTLEVDTIVLQPLDELFDLILDRTVAPNLAHKNEIIPEQVDFISTRTAHQSVDHSFFIARTSQRLYKEMADHVAHYHHNETQHHNHHDDYNETKKISFDDFLNEVYGEDHFELDNCVYNTYVGTQDCNVPFKDIQLAHFASCGAPWTCPNNNKNDICRLLHREWHRNRQLLDQDLGNDIPEHADNDDTFGYCSVEGQFSPIQITITDPDTI